MAFNTARDLQEATVGSEKIIGIAMHRSVDSFVHQLRAGRDQTPVHDELRRLYDEAIDKMNILADGLYKKARAQVDDHEHQD